MPHPIPSTHPTQRDLPSRIPTTEFHNRKDGEREDIPTDAIFKGKKVVVLGLPGAFTPTCSSTHLPRYEALHPQFKKLGVDEVVCVSVNDGFVMEAWGKDQGLHNVRLLADGNGDFTAGVGMLVDKSDLGFGARSWRYSMLVEDGQITQRFIEPDKPGDPFEVSDADTMLRHLDPDIALPSAITLFTRPGCPYCARARRLLGEHDLPFEEFILDTPRPDSASNTSLKNVTGETTTPQVYIDGKHIGGSDALAAWLDR